MKNFEILSTARLEYANAVEWYLAKSVSAADRFAVEVETAIESIRKHPDWYPRWDDTYRFYLLKKFPYFVAYRQTEDKVVIVAFRHAAQDQDAWLGR